MTVVDRIPILHDERGVSVIFGTLLLILITIIAASGVAFMVSTTQQDMMEREAQISAVENEHLKIVSIDPVGNSTHWNSINITVQNLNTADSYITGINLNGIFAKNYLGSDGQGNLDQYKNYPMIYNFNRRVMIPAAKSKEIHLNLTQISISNAETFDTSDWTAENESYSLFLPGHPLDVYPDIAYSEDIYNSSNSLMADSDYTIDDSSGLITIVDSSEMNPFFTETINVSGWENNSENFTFPLYNSQIMVNSEEVSNSSAVFSSANNYSINYTQGNVTLIGSESGGNLSNTSNYNITYKISDNNYDITYMMDFESFTKPLSVTKGEPVVIELMTSLINIFKETFMPPVPLAEVQFETERLVDSNGSVSFNDYLMLDASESFDQDGFITSYRWAVWNNSTLVYDYNLTGVIVRPTKLNLETANNIEIDLEVVDDNGMVSRLSQRSGNITVL